ncbi:MAG: tetratricopeptide repeat protein, partial [Duncaniella sp.]|nr:tetratricopeptide repeat protein [Duncaniella sp.]
MNRLFRTLALTLIASLTGLTAIAAPAEEKKSSADHSTRRERNYIVEGNRLYRQERYADAEVAYRKALELDALSDIARFNLAASLLRQGSATGENQKNASQILTALANDAENATVAELAAFNLGNIAYNGQDYGRAIECYKQSLRRNPDNDKAR